MSDEAITKLMGSLMFDLAPLETNLKRVDQIVRHMSVAGNRLEKQFKKIDLANFDEKNLAAQQKLIALKLKEAKVQESIASTRLKEAQASRINLSQQSQAALIQQRLAQAGQAALRTKQMEADLQNKLATAENRRLSIATKRLQLEQKMRQMEMGIIGSVGGAGGGAGKDYTFGGALEHRLGWFMSSMAFFGSGMVFSDILTKMGEVEMGMTQIARVTEDATASFSVMRDELFDLAKDYGTQMSTVQDIALRWAQAGYNVSDTLTLTENSLLALNTAELDAEQSTQALIGIMAQWNLQAEDTRLIIDKINKTADDFALSSQDLVDGLLRSSGAARAMGMSFDETLAVLTAMREASGRTGREVGNALNSIFSYMQRPTAIKTFEKMGIKVFANEARTEFRNVIGILDELSVKWDDASESARDGFVQAADEAGLFNEELANALDTQEQWTDLQKRDLTQAAAGVYRRNYLIALLRNFAQVQEVVNNLQDAEGYSLKENTRTMETYQKKVEALKAAATELAVAIGDAGLLGIMKGLVDGTKEAIDAFNDLPPDARNAIILFLELGAAIGFANLAMRTFTGAGFGYLLTGLAAKISGVTAASIGLGNAMKVLLLNPIGILITALGAGAVALNLYKKHQEQAIQESIDAAIKTNNQAKEVSKLTEEYDKFSKQLQEGKDVQDDLKRTMQAIAETFPDVVNGWDEQGNAISINNERLRENIRLANESAIANARAGFSMAQKRLVEIGAEQAELNSPYTIEMDGQVATMPEGGLSPRLAKVRSDRALELAKERGELLGKLSQLNSVLYGSIEETGFLGAAMSRSSSGARAGKSGGAGGGTGAGDSQGSGGALKESANEAKLAMDEYNNALDYNSTLLNGLQTREQILDLLIKNQKIPTLEQARQKYSLLNEAIALNEERQGLLGRAADEARAQLAPLTDQLDSLTQKHESGTLSTKDFNAAVSALRPTIQSLEKDIAQYGNQWWEAEGAIRSAADAQQDMVREYVQAAREIEQANEKIELETARDSALKKLKDQQEDAKEASEDRIKSLQDEIDALGEENDLLQEQESLRERETELQEKKLALIDAEQRLANIQSQRNTRVLQNGIWEWIADPNAVKDAQEAVTNAQKDVADAEKALGDTRQQIADNARKRELQSQIESEREKQREQEESHDKQIKEAEEYWKNRIEVSEKKWEILLNAEQLQIDSYNEIVQVGLSAALEKWESYYRRVQEIQEAAAMGELMGESGGGYSSYSSNSRGNQTSNYPLSGMIVPAFKRGGPIRRDEMIMAHADEYMLNAETVRAAGGVPGVEKLVAAINMPSLKAPVVAPSAPNQMTHVDRGVNINGPIHLTHVYDASGFLRNLKQYAV